MAKQCGGKLPFMCVQDAPDFANRGFMLDISRNKVPTLATLKLLVDYLSAVDELLHCVRDTANVGVPTVVVHAFIGFDDHTPTQQGLDNVGLLVDEAKRCSVRLAFENTEGEEYLAAIMQAFADRAHVGFCWDTGHEMCYNHSQDMLALYGDRLFCTHINDNLGISDFDGNTTWLDDLHLLPYDGIAKRLVACGYNGELTFELNTRSKPDRHDNDKYTKLPLTDHLAEAYARACRFAAEVPKVSLAVCSVEMANT